MTAVSSTGGAVTQRSLLAKLKRAFLTPIRAMRLRYLPLLMIYYAYGALGLVAIAEAFWIKEALTLSPADLAAIAVWLTLPWTIKMVFYIANEDNSMVTVMDTKSGEVKAEIPVGVEPEGMGVSPDSKFTVATSESTSMAHVIDNATEKLIANVLVDTRPREAKFTPDGKEVWVSSEVGGTVSVIDASDWKVKKKIRFEVPGVRPELLQPVGIEFTKDGKYVFAALGPGNRVAVIDPETYEVKQYILVGQRPWHLELSSDQSKLYVANGLTNDMTVIDVASLKAEKSVPVGRLPWGVAVVK